MKQVLIASDDDHTSAWVASAIDSLDVTSAKIGLAEVGPQLNEVDTDVVILDAGREPEALVQVIDRAVNGGVDVKLMLLIEPDALDTLRMPTGLMADFMVRGSSSEELAARIRALLWPGEEASSEELIRLDSLTINLATYQAAIDGTPIDFTYLEYALFAFLVTHPGRAYNREVLLRRVWGADYYGGSRTVDVHVRRIRAKIGSELGKRLETVRNVGYLWHGV